MQQILRVCVCVIVLNTATARHRLRSLWMETGKQWPPLCSANEFINHHITACNMKVAVIIVNIIYIIWPNARWKVSLSLLLSTTVPLPYPYCNTASPVVISKSSQYIILWHLLRHQNRTNMYVRTRRNKWPIKIWSEDKIRKQNNRLRRASESKKKNKDRLWCWLFQYPWRIMSKANVRHCHHTKCALCYVDNLINIWTEPSYQIMQNHWRPKNCYITKLS